MDKKNTTAKMTIKKRDILTKWENTKIIILIIILMQTSINFYVFKCKSSFIIAKTKFFQDIDGKKGLRCIFASNGLNPFRTNPLVVMGGMGGEGEGRFSPPP